MNVSNHAKSFSLIVVSLLGIFLLDLFLPRGYNISLLYFVPLLFTLSPSAPPPLGVLIPILAFLLIDSLINRPLVVPPHVFAFNRTMLALLLASMAYLIKWQNGISTRLRESEEFQRSILAASQLGLAAVRGRKFLWVNDALSTLAGYRKDQLVGKSVRILYSQEEFERIGREVYAELAEKGKATTETRWLLPDGIWRDILLNSALIDPGDPSAGAMFSAMDITARKKTEDELARQRQTFQALAEHSPDVICLYDADARMRYVNKTITKYTGKDPGYYIGKTIHELDVPDTIRTTWQEMFDEAMSTSKGYSREMDFSSLEGPRIFVNTYFPVLSEDGNPEAVINFAHDVTDFKRIQRMLEQRAREAEEGRTTLETLMSNVPSGVLIIEGDGRVRMISDYFLRMLELTQRDVVGTPFLKVVERAQVSNPDGSRVPYADLALSRALRQGESVSGLEQLIKTPAGRRMPVLVNAAPILDGKGRPAGGIIVWNDISKLKQAEEVLRRDKETFERLVMERTRELISAQVELEQARRLSDIGSLAATVAHELRNPLGVIRAASYNIKRRAGHAPINMQLTNIEKKITQSDQIINNLLFYARLKRPQFERIDLYTVLEESIDSFRKRYADFHVEEELDGIRGVEMEADPLQLTELFNNVISNAYDAVRARHGMVWIRGEPQDSSVRLVFRDNGEGMTQDELKKVFEPFYTTKAKGTGLGLTVSRQIVALHQGSIDIKSEKGKGTVFSVTLPVSHPATAPAGR